jgi:uncharacterized protein YeaO (DUF488 family)
VPGRVTTRRWNDSPSPGEGTRILVTRYRPRGVRQADAPWDEWCAALAPSVELHAAAYGKDQPAIAWPEYRRRYLEEMTQAKPSYFLRALGDRVRAGEDVVLLCSSACVDEQRCHRSLLAALVLG